MPKKTATATAKSVSVYDKDGKFVRTYTEEDQGDNFAELAEEYAGKIGGFAELAEEYAGKIGGKVRAGVEE